MVRTASDLIFEIGHDLDEIATGWSQNEDGLIDVGINDARRELEELRKVIMEVEKVDPKEDASKAYGDVEKEALEKLGEICVDFHERTPGHTQFCSILTAFMGLSEITPWVTEASPFATNTSSIMCLPLSQYKKLRILQHELKNFLDHAKQGFNEKIYGSMELEQEKEVLI